MEFLHWITLASMLGVLCWGIAHWYRQRLDVREAKYGWVWKNEVMK